MCFTGFPVVLVEEVRNERALKYSRKTIDSNGW